MHLGCLGVQAYVWLPGRLRAEDFATEQHCNAHRLLKKKDYQTSGIDITTTTAPTTSMTTAQQVLLPLLPTPIPWGLSIFVDLRLSRLLETVPGYQRNAWFVFLGGTFCGRSVASSRKPRYYNEDLNSHPRKIDSCSQSR